MEEISTKKRYALKYINKKRCIKKRSVDNVFRERLMLQEIEHPYIMNLEFAFQDDDNMFMIFNLALGGDTRFHLGVLGGYSEWTCKVYIAEIAYALQYIHANQIIHRYALFTLSLPDHGI